LMSNRAARSISRGKTSPRAIGAATISPAICATPTRCSRMARAGHMLILRCQHVGCEPTQTPWMGFFCAPVAMTIGSWPERRPDDRVRSQLEPDVQLLCQQVGDRPSQSRRERAGGRDGSIDHVADLRDRDLFARGFRAGPLLLPAAIEFL